MSALNDAERQVSMAKEVLSTFLQHGENLADQRHVIHYAYGGNWEAMARSLAELGYQVRPTVDADGLVAERNDVTDLAWADRTMRQMCEIADQFGVEYDGWEGSMERQQPEPDPRGKASLFGKLFGKKN